jgi:hypothetical protein
VTFKGLLWDGKFEGKEIVCGPDGDTYVNNLPGGGAYHTHNNVSFFLSLL